MFNQIEAADADNGYKSMWMKSSADKVLEAYLRYVFQCFFMGYAI